MIVGMGIDIVELARIEKSLGRFGLRFAAKEAAVKALGTGFSQGIGPAQVETVSGPGGKPNLLLHGEALQQAQAMGVTRCHVSISHDRSSAVAVVVLES